MSDKVEKKRDKESIFISTLLESAMLVQSYRFPN